MGDEAFDAAKRLGQRENPGRLGEAPHRAAAAGDLKTQHCAKAALLRLGDEVGGVRGQARVMDGFNTRMLAQEHGDGAGRLLLALDAREQRPEAAQRQIGVEGRARDACNVGPVLHGLDIVRVGGNHGAADDIRMAVQEFGRGMDDMVGAERDRPLQGGRQEGVVDGDLRSRLFGARGKGADVDDPHHRIAGRFDHDEFGPAAERRGQRRLVAEVDERDAEMTFVRAGAEQPLDAAVAIIGGEDEIARLQRRQHEIDRRHPARQRHRAGAALEFGQGVGENVAGWIAGAGIFMRARPLETLEGEGAGEIDRRRHRAKGAVPRDAIGGGDGLGRFLVGHRSDSSVRVRWPKPVWLRPAPDGMGLAAPYGRGLVGPYKIGLAPLAQAVRRVAIAQKHV